MTKPRGDGIQSQDNSLFSGWVSQHITGSQSTVKSLYFDYRSISWKRTSTLCCDLATTKLLRERKCRRTPRDHHDQRGTSRMLPDASVCTLIWRHCGCWSYDSRIHYTVITPPTTTTTITKRDFSDSRITSAGSGQSYILVQKCLTPKLGLLWPGN